MTPSYRIVDIYNLVLTLTHAEALIAVDKKTFRYSNVFFYNRLYQPYVFRIFF
jgi:hypothetical protein